jgi:hypothetical protein
MYCPTRECEFESWAGKCPNCKNPLQGGKPPVSSTTGQQDNYHTLG